MREPMFLLLIACGSIYLVLGDLEEALMLLAFVFVIMGITFYQERKTENTLEALRDLSSPRALVIRDGQQKRIAGRSGHRGHHHAPDGGPDPSRRRGPLLQQPPHQRVAFNRESAPVRKVSCGGILDMHPQVVTASHRCSPGPWWCRGRSGPGNENRPPDRDGPDR